MKCWILLILLFCNGNCGAGCGSARVIDECCENRRREERVARNTCRPESCIEPRRTEACRPSCQTERTVVDRDCDCERNCECNANRSEARFESRQFMNFSAGCGCEEERNNDCGCGR